MNALVNNGAVVQLEPAYREAEKDRLRFQVKLLASMPAQILLPLRPQDQQTQDGGITLTVQSFTSSCSSGTWRDGGSSRLRSAS